MMAATSRVFCVPPIRDGSKKETIIFDHVLWQLNGEQLTGRAFPAFRGAHINIVTVKERDLRKVNVVTVFRILVPANGGVSEKNHPLCLIDADRLPLK